MFCFCGVLNMAQKAENKRSKRSQQEKKGIRDDYRIRITCLFGFIMQNNMIALPLKVFYVASGKIILMIVHRINLVLSERN